MERELIAWLKAKIAECDAANKPATARRYRLKLHTAYITIANGDAEHALLAFQADNGFNH